MDKQRYDSILAPATLLHSVFRHSPVGMAILTAADGVYVEANDAFAKLVGSSREDILGRSFTTSSLNLDIDRDMALDILRRSRRISDVAFSLAREDGTQQACIASLQLEEFDGADYFFFIVQDISEQDEAQLALQQSEQRFGLFFSSVPLPLLVIDESTFRVLDVNPAACRLYGYSHDEFVGISLSDLIPMGALGNSSISSIKSAGVGNSIITTQTLKDNTVIEANITSYSFSLEGRRASLSIVQDVTEQRAMQAALVASEERQHIIADLTADAIWDRDMVTNAITWSVGLSTLFGHEPEDTTNYDWWLNHVHPEDHQQIVDSLIATLDTVKTNWSGEYRFRRSDGSYAHVLDKGHIVRDPDGRPVRFMGSMVDISEQLQVAEFAARAALEERQRLAHTLHDSVTHSLYSVSLLAEASRRRAESGDPVVSMDHIQRLCDLTIQTLRQMRLMVFDLRPGVLEQEGLVGALRNRLEAVEHRAGIKARLFDDTRAPIPSELQSELFWIAQEALNNSLRHASATAVTVHLTHESGEIVLEIADNGLGFASGPPDATGGLAAIRRRAAELSGTLELTQEANGGAKLRVSIPV